MDKQIELKLEITISINPDDIKEFGADATKPYLEGYYMRHAENYLETFEKIVFNKGDEISESEIYVEFK